MAGCLQDTCQNKAVLTVKDICACSRAVLSKNLWLGGIISYLNELLILNSLRLRSIVAIAAVKSVGFCPKLVSYSSYLQVGGAIPLGGSLSCSRSQLCAVEISKSFALLSVPVAVLCLYAKTSDAPIPFFGIPVAPF